ncbi:MAG: hypothetical protein JNK76_07675 [Planctomycetales bacterium]|nr:hypothetical protein [Planctomycetales bacterium]MBN8626096.1 hypothetical protein [Planctomycetota bacterium]
MSHNFEPPTVEPPPQQYRLLTMLGVVTLTAVIFALVRRMRPETQIGWAWVAAFAGVWIATTYGARVLIRSSAAHVNSRFIMVVVSQAYLPITLSGWVFLAPLAGAVAVDPVTPSLLLLVWIAACVVVAATIAVFVSLLTGSAIHDDRQVLVAGGLAAFVIALGSQAWFFAASGSADHAGQYTTSLVYFTPLGMVFAARAVDYRNRCLRLIAQQEIERLLAEDLSPGR